MTRIIPTLASRSLSRFTIATLVLGAMLFGTSAADAALTTGKCLVLKRQAWGTRRKCEATEQVKQLKGKPADLAKCQTKFQEKLAKITAQAADAAIACRYGDNGDRTVTDYDTGLQWEKKTGTFVINVGFVCIGGDVARCVNNTYNWNDAMAFADATTDPAGATLATCVLGHCDWRLPKITELRAKLPKQYRIELGGIAEESVESRESVFAVVPLMLALMLTVLMFQLQSFRKLAIVLIVLPLGMIGVVASLLLFNRPLGFVAILGILSLLGMIAKNAVILLVQIESDRAEGKSVWDAVVAAGTSRLRPMSLTALSTVLGLIPIAPTVFWGPMAFAIMGGLMVATLLTLVFLPTVYVTVFGGKPGAAAPSPAAGTASPQKLSTP